MSLEIAIGIEANTKRSMSSVKNRDQKSRFSCELRDTSRSFEGRKLINSIET